MTAGRMRYSKGDEPVRYEIEPVGVVSTGRRRTDDDFWGRTSAAIDLSERFGEDALRGLAAFSHVEVVYLFHAVPPSGAVVGARHPRNNPSWPAVGIFAQRAKNRPNRLGSTICRVVSVEGTRLVVAELDAVAGTPVVDIKPVMQEFLPRESVRQPDWSHELMAQYWLPASDAADGGHRDANDVTAGCAPATRARVSRLTATDIGRARELFVLMTSLLEAEAEPLSDGYLARLLRRDDFWALAASVEGRVVGGLTAHVLPMTRGELAEVFVYDLAVAAEYRRQGIGRDLVAAVRALAESAGIPVVFVPAGGDDARAAAFYRAAGGTPEAATIFTFGSTSG